VKPSSTNHIFLCILRPKYSLLTLSRERERERERERSPNIITRVRRSNTYSYLLLSLEGERYNIVKIAQYRVGFGYKFA
jgi:hypothetical protein